MAQGEATPAVFVSQLGNPSLLSLITQRQCQPPPEVSSSGILYCVAWPAEVLIVREPRSQQPSRDTGDSQGLGICLSHQTSQQMRENLWGDHRKERVTVSFMLQKDHVGVGCEMHRGAGNFVRA